MRYYSTNNLRHIVDMREAVTSSVPVCGGLYMPQSLPSIPKAFVRNMPDMSLREIAYATTNVFLGEDLDSSVIKRIVDRTFTFDTPIVEVSDKLFVLELFHGPTAVFKDVGARFLSELLSTINDKTARRLNVLVATTGNTGGAIANAFKNKEGIDVTLLYPYGAISRESATSMLADNNNINALEVTGTIDDCKKIISEAFNDVTLRDRIAICSANSTNFARLIPQLALFFYAVAQMSKRGIETKTYDIALPSGNLGMLTSGVMAKRIGLDCGTLIAACNANNAFDRFLKAGDCKIRSTEKTLAPLMDMATPSNLPRLMDLYNSDLDMMKRDVSSATINDDLIARTVRKVAETSGYIADPHTAVAIASLDQRPDLTRSGLVFSTAAPSRSAKIMNEILGDVFTAESTEHPAHTSRKPLRMSPTIQSLKRFLLSG